MGPVRGSEVARVPGPACLHACTWTLGEERYQLSYMRIIISHSEKGSLWRPLFWHILC